MFVGPVFTRQAAIAPRRVWFYAAPTLFVAAMFGIVVTSWQLLIGSQRVENLGDLAWFGATVMQILAPLQLAVAMPFSRFWSPRPWRWKKTARRSSCC